MSSLLLDPSLFLPPRIGEHLHLEPGKNARPPTLFVLWKTNDKGLPEVAKAISKIGEALAAEPIRSREDVIARFHLMERIDNLQIQVIMANLSGENFESSPIYLKELFPQVEFWSELGKSTVIGREHLRLSEMRRIEFLELLKIDPQKPPRAKTSLDLVLAKRANFLSLTISEQVETLIELYEETDDEKVKTRLEKVFSKYSTNQVLTALGLDAIREENWKTGPYPLICANLSVWIPLFSEKHWNEVSKSVFFLLISQIEKFSAGLPVERFRSLYLKHDPEFLELFSVARATKRLFFLPALLRVDTPEHTTETKTFIRNATPAWIEPFFSDRRTSSVITAYIANFLSSDQIESLAPDLFKNGANALLKVKIPFCNSDGETKTAWFSFLFLKTISNDPSCLKPLYTLLKSVSPSSEIPLLLATFTPETLWRLLLASSTDPVICAQFLQWLPETKWHEMLAASHLNTAIALFEDGVFDPFPAMPLLLNFFGEQQALEPFQLDSLIKGANNYLHPLMGEFQADCEKKLEDLFLKNLPNRPTPESSKFFAENVTTLSRDLLFELTHRKKEALLAHIITLKTPGLKTLLALLDFEESDPLDTELIEAITDIDYRLISLWSDIHESPRDKLSAEAFNNYGKKHE